ncbi:MAG: DUF1343 domain-containing protein [Deltaproteobacteria bacterium]|jgi:uncharacterized protein YbbC (DUF1343 family)|nr:DUF1343 domain-containing protein [Deltaproteobacteria bacterium]
MILINPQNQIQDSTPQVYSGLEVAINDHLDTLKGRPLGLLANQASVDSRYQHALDLFDSFLPGAIKAVFSPQHGWAGEKQDNMIESSDSLTQDGRPLYSLYGQTRKPSPEQFNGLSALLVDLPDVGVRVYTFAQTLFYAMQTASVTGTEIIVLDRPNPIGGLAMEGNILDDDCLSFVGLHPIPMRHGLTLGELAIFMASKMTSPPPITVIPCRGWSRWMYFKDTNLPWVLPSPNLPTPETAMIYPGQVLWEGTNLSEGRGTTKPFHLVGAPYIAPQVLAGELKSLDLPGVVFRPTYFQPTFNKWAGQVCGGLEIHPTSREMKPYLTSLSILEKVLKLFNQDFRLKDPPYEYEWRRRPIDLILGRRSIFDDLAKGVSAQEICSKFDKELKTYQKTVEQIYLYH